MRIAIATAMLCLMALARPALAQGVAEPKVVCRMCRDLGTKPCRKHKKQMALETSANVVGCSVAIACKTCSGALAIDCKACDNPSSEQRLKRRIALGKALLTSRRQRVAKAPNVAGFLYLKTPHCDLTFSLHAATINKKKIDAHTLMHVYGDRIEQLRALFQETLEVTDSDMPERLRVFLFHAQKDHAVIGPQETGFGAANSSGLKLMGPEFAYSMWQDPRTMRSDAAVHRNVVHSVTHLLLSQMRPMLFLGNKRHGWVDEGVAHWFEDRLTGRCMNFCFEEVLLQAGANFKGGLWRAPVRKLVDEKKAVSFAALSRCNTDQLTFEQHAIAFAYVDFLITAHGGAKFRDFVRLLKKGSATRDALQATYGWNSLTIEPVFRAWVVANYSRKR